MKRRSRWLRAAVIGSLAAVVLPAASASARTARTAAPAPPLRWLARSGAPDAFEVPVGIAATADGENVAVVGTSSGPTTGRDVVTTVYDAGSGAVRWSARFDGTAHMNDAAVGIAAAPDGQTVYVAATSVGMGSRSDYVTIAYDVTTGDVRWASRFDGAAHGKDTVAAIAVAPDGSDVYVVGTTYAGTASGPPSMTTVAYVAANGIARWQESYGGPDPTADPLEFAHALVVSPDGTTVFVTGEGYVPPDYSDSGRSFDVVAYHAPDGVPLWDARPIGWPCSYPTPRSLTISPDGAILVVTGQQDEGCNTSFSGYATAALNTRTGETLWSTSPTGEYWTSTAGATAVAFTPDGSRLIQTGNLLSPRYGTMAYDPQDGSAMWHATYAGDHGWDLATGVVTSPDSRFVFVTGYSHGDIGGWDYATIAYRASDGHRAWIARYDDRRHGADAAYALAIAPDGATLYVTGWADGTDGDIDMVTLAYQIA